MYRSVPLFVLFLASACGDDGGVNNLPDAPLVPDAPLTPAATLSIDPGTLVLGAGVTAMVTATIEREGGFDGEVVVEATTTTGLLTLVGATIAAGETSAPLMVTATAGIETSMFDVTVTATASVTIDPVDLPVRVAGLAGPAIAGKAAGEQSGTTSALSADGTRVVIGAPLSDAGGNETGLVRVYERTGNTWAQVGADIQGEAAGDRFGGAVAISNDGARIAVGAYLNDGNGAASGHVRVFELVGGAWTQLGADLDGINASDGHGASVAMSASGSRVVVGAPGVNNDAGSMHVYGWSGTAWAPVGLPISGGLALGHQVDISDDGNRVATSQPSAAGMQLPGQVQAYELSGTTWAPLGGLILGIDPGGNAGGSFAMSADGTTLSIAAHQSDLGGSSSGEVRVYRFSAGVWTQLGEALAGPAGSRMGASVSLSGDGTRLLVGGSSQSLVRLYTFTNNAWTLSSGLSFGSGANTGSAVAISADGMTASIGAPYADSPLDASGQVRLYDLP